MFNGEMSCRPHLSIRLQALATKPRHLLGPTPRPRGRGLEKHRSLPRLPPARPALGPRGSLQPLEPEPGQSQSHPRAGGRLNVKIMLTTDVKSNQLSLAPLALLSAQDHVQEEGGGPQGDLSAKTPQHEHQF